MQLFIIFSSVCVCVCFEWHLQRFCVLYAPPPAHWDAYFSIHSFLMQVRMFPFSQLSSFHNFHFHLFYSLTLTIYMHACMCVYCFRHDVVCFRQVVAVFCCMQRSDSATLVCKAQSTVTLQCKLFRIFIYSKWWKCFFFRSTIHCYIILIIQQLIACFSSYRKETLYTSIVHHLWLCLCLNLCCVFSSSKVCKSLFYCVSHFLCCHAAAIWRRDLSYAIDKFRYFMTRRLNFAAFILPHKQG